MEGKHNKTSDTERSTLSYRMVPQLMTHLLVERHHAEDRCLGLVLRILALALSLSLSLFSIGWTNSLAYAGGVHGGNRRGYANRKLPKPTDHFLRAGRHPTCHCAQLCIQRQRNTPHHRSSAPTIKHFPDTSPPTSHVCFCSSIGALTLAGIKRRRLVSHCLHRAEPDSPFGGKRNYS